MSLSPSGSLLTGYHSCAEMHQYLSAQMASSWCVYTSDMILHFCFVSKFWDQGCTYIVLPAFLGQNTGSSQMQYCDLCIIMLPVQSYCFHSVRDSFIYLYAHNIFMNIITIILYFPCYHFYAGYLQLHT